MGGFAPWMSAALGLAGLAYGLDRGEGQYRQMRQSLEQRKRQEMRERDVRRQVDEKRRKRQLAKDRARMQAFLASRGLDSARGSSRAVLRGLTEESRQEATDRDAFHRLGIDAIDRRYQKNLLALEEQRRRRRQSTLRDFLRGTPRLDPSPRLPDIFTSGRWPRRSLL